MAKGKFVAYYRVSRESQRRSGLGLAAQREAVAQFLNGGPWKLVGEFQDVETGKHEERPGLAEAQRLAKLTGATLLIAKLDRLSRNAAFLLTLQNGAVRFICCDNPHANELTIGVLAVVAQDERKRISERTRAALAQKRIQLARVGKRLGNPNGAKHLRKYGTKRAVAAVKAQATERATGLRDVVAHIQASGATSLRAIADALNDRDIMTARGGRWHAASVARVIERIERAGT